MNFLLISDFHGTSRKPINRLDNIIETYRRKLKFILDKALENSASIISSGDFFDTPRDFTVLYEFLKIYKNYFKEVKIYTVYGQHDLYYRSKSFITNIGLLSKVGWVKVLSKKELILDKKVSLYGCDWESKVPEVENKRKFNILAIHAPIAKRKLFFGHQILKTHKIQKENPFYKLIICGDIHKPFIEESKNGIICNTGPILRLGINEKEHKPRIYLFNSDKEEIQKIFIPIEENKIVFDEKIKDKETFLDGLSENFNFEKYRNDLDIHRIINDVLKQKEFLRYNRKIKRIIGEL